MITTDQKQYIDMIFRAPSAKEAFEIFRKHESELCNVSFVIATEKGSIPGFATNQYFSKTGAIRSPFGKMPVIMLDQATVNEMRDGGSVIACDYVISFDTGALSYMAPYLRDSSNAVSLFAEALQFIVENEVHYEPMPYFFENLERFYSQEERIKNSIFDRVRGYEALRTLDKELWRSIGQVRSKLTAAELNVSTQSLITNFLYDAETTMTQEIRFHYNILYCLLLKAAALHIDDPDAGSINKKVKGLFHFLDRDLAFIPQMETLLVRSFLEKGTNHKFFSRVMKRNHKLIEALKNMAWDLTHLRHLYRCIAVKTMPTIRYTFSALLTFDAALTDILDEFPLHACAIVRGTDKARVIPFLACNWLETMSGSLDPSFVSSYFEEDAVQRRESRQKRSLSELEVLKCSLEKEVSRIAEIPLPE